MIVECTLEQYKPADISPFRKRKRIDIITAIVWNFYADNPVEINLSVSWERRSAWALLYLTFVQLEREQVMRTVSDYSRFDLPQLLPASN